MQGKTEEKRLKKSVKFFPLMTYMFSLISVEVSFIFWYNSIILEETFLCLCFSVPEQERPHLATDFMPTYPIVHAHGVLLSAYFPFQATRKHGP